MDTTVASRKTPVKVKGPFDLYLKAGLAVSLRTAAGNVMAAQITGISHNQLGVKLSEPVVPTPFGTGERIRIKYWDEGSTVYGWWGLVEGLQTLDGQRMEITFSDIEIHLERRKAHRLPLKVPFSFTIVNSAEKDLIGLQVLDSASQDISVGGLRFETELPLRVGDQLDLRLELTPDLSVSAVGWVVRSESILPEQQVDTLGQNVQSVAIQFLQSSTDEQRELLRFLAQSQSV